MPVSPDIQRLFDLSDEASVRVTEILGRVDRECQRALELVRASELLVLRERATLETIETEAR